MKSTITKTMGVLLIAMLSVMSFAVAETGTNTQATTTSVGAADTKAMPTVNSAVNTGRTRALANVAINDRAPTADELCSKFVKASDKEGYYRCVKRYEMSVRRANLADSPNVVANDARSEYRKKLQETRRNRLANAIDANTLTDDQRAALEKRRAYLSGDITKPSLSNEEKADYMYGRLKAALEKVTSSLRSVANYQDKLSERIANNDNRDFAKAEAFLADARADYDTAMETVDRAQAYLNSEANTLTGNSEYASARKLVNEANKLAKSSVRNTRGAYLAIMAAPIINGNDGITSADLNSDGMVNIEDLNMVLANWGSCDVGADDIDCYDLNSDQAVGEYELNLVLALWDSDGQLPPTIAADLNGDEIVDAADLNLLLGNWGPCANDEPANLASSIAQCVGDIDGDGTVGDQDMQLLLLLWS